jgi:hypothetical protein
MKNKTLWRAVRMWVLFFMALSFESGTAISFDQVEKPEIRVPQISSPEILKILQAKDQVFESAQLGYTVTGVAEFPPDVDWQNQNGDTRGASDKTEKLLVVYHEQMVVRGPEVTFWRELDKSVGETPSGKSVGRYEKTSNARGLGRSISRVWESGAKGHSVYEVQPGGRPGSPLSDYRAKIEYTLGMGFGKRITAIDAVRTNGENVVVSGKITLWWTDKSVFEIELDKDFIVRRAKMETDLASSVATYEIITSGTAGEGNFVIARSGSYRHTVAEKGRDGKLTGNVGTVEQREVAYDAIKLNLTDDEYKKLIDFPLSPGTQVIDRVAGISYFIGADGKPEAKHRNLSEIADSARSHLNGSAPQAQASRQVASNEQAAQQPNEKVEYFAGEQIPANHIVRNYVLGAIAIAGVLGVFLYFARHKAHKNKKSPSS